MEKYSTCTVSCTVSGDDRTKKNTFFHHAVQAMKKRCYTFYNENRMYIPVCSLIEKILFVKKYLDLLWLFIDFSIFLLLSEHTHCNKMATHLNSENAISRIGVGLWGSVGMGKK